MDIYKTDGSSNATNNYAGKSFSRFNITDITTPPRFVSYSNKRLHLIPQLEYLDEKTRREMLDAANIFPVKVNNYVLENLIDWNNVPDDPIYKLVFPHSGMMTDNAAIQLQKLNRDTKTPDERKEILRNIRDGMNPHTSGQISNIPTFDGQPVKGVQHKYRETVLFFPKQAQTCHSYCTFCFRWPQFIETSAPKFESNDLDELYQYLRTSEHVSDLLLTGGDPMILNARRIGELFDVILKPELSHINTLRIGTKSLSYWPYRFFSDSDSESVLNHIRRLVNSGKQVAFMVHINHWKEMQTEAFEHAVAAIRSTGAIIRSQSPIIRHVNDSADVWVKNWTRQTELGIQPYYMFVERDTGASHHFSIPLLKAHDIYKKATSQVSGLCRTARGPIMSANAGKIQVLGPVEINDKKAIALTMLQGRNADSVHTPFLAKYSETATWIDELEPFSSETPFPFN